MNGFILSISGMIRFRIMYECPSRLKRMLFKIVQVGTRDDGAGVAPPGTQPALARTATRSQSADSSLRTSSWGENSGVTQVRSTSTNVLHGSSERLDSVGRDGRIHGTLGQDASVQKTRAEGGGTTVDRWFRRSTDRSGGMTKI